MRSCRLHAQASLKIPSNIPPRAPNSPSPKEKNKHQLCTIIPEPFLPRNDIPVRLTRAKTYTVASTAPPPLHPQDQFTEKMKFPPCACQRSEPAFRAARERLTPHLHSPRQTAIASAPPSRYRDPVTTPALLEQQASFKTASAAGTQPSILLVFSLARSSLLAPNSARQRRLSFT